MRTCIHHIVVLAMFAGLVPAACAQINHQLVLQQPATLQREVDAAFQTQSGAQVLLFHAGSTIDLRRFDASGAPEWSKTFNAPWTVRRAVFAADGGDGFHLLVSGPFEFVNVSTSAPDTLRHHFRIMHFDASGSMTWGRAYQRQMTETFMISGYNDQVLELAWYAGGLYLSRVSPVYPGTHAEVWRLNAAGDLQWARQIGELPVLGGLPMTAHEPPSDGALVPHGAGSFLLLATGSPIGHPVLVNVDQTGSVQWANKYVYGTSPVTYGNVNDLALDDNGDVVLNCGLQPAIGIGPYRYLPRISPSGALVRADVFDIGRTFPRSRIFTHPSGELSLMNWDWNTLLMHRMVGIMRVNASGGAATSFLQGTHSDAPHSYGNLWMRATMVDDQLFIGGDLQQKDEIFGTYQYWPTLTQIDLAAPQYSCLLQDTLLAHYAVPLSVISVQPQPGMTSVATDSLFTITPYAPTIASIPDIPTTGLCNMVVGMEALPAKPSGFTLVTNLLAPGELIRLRDLSAGRLRLVDAAGRALAVRDVPVSGALELSTTGMASGLLLVEWTSYDGLHRQVERVVLE